MDNRRRVSRKVLRQRQLGALAVIAFVVLLFVVLLAKCTKNMGEGSGSKAETTTTTAATEAIVTAPPETATVTTTAAVNPKASNVKLSKREIFIDVGEKDMSVIQAYPDAGTGESDEVWTSMDPTIATVDNIGNITGVSKGQTLIILSFKNYPDIEIEIKVNVGGSDTPALATTAPEEDDPLATTTTTVANAGLA